MAHNDDIFPWEFHSSNHEYRLTLTEGWAPAMEDRYVYVREVDERQWRIWVTGRDEPETGSFQSAEQAQWWVENVILQMGRDRFPGVPSFPVRSAETTVDRFRVAGDMKRCISGLRKPLSALRRSPSWESPAYGQVVCEFVEGMEAHLDRLQEFLVEITAPDPDG